jgi:G-patch domain
MNQRTTMETLSTRSVSFTKHKPLYRFIKCESSCAAHQLLTLSNSLVSLNQNKAGRSNDYQNQGNYQANLNQNAIGALNSDDGWSNDYQNRGNFQTNRNQNDQVASNSNWNQNRQQNNFGPARNKATNFHNNNNRQQQQQKWPAAIPNTALDEFPMAPPPINNNFKNRGAPYNRNSLGGNRGAHLLKKMGWQPGEGLGKDQSGTVQPLMMRGQTGQNKRGFSSKEEWHKQRTQFPQQPKKAKVKELKVDGKHPISVLCEYAMLHKYHLPHYIVKSESGEPHLKTFIFSVKLNDIEYIMPDNNEHHVKKKAKEIVTRYCLEQLGIKVQSEPTSG